MINYSYRKSKTDAIWTVGHYDDTNVWRPESDHESKDGALARIDYLNQTPLPSSPQGVGRLQELQTTYIVTQQAMPINLAEASFCRASDAIEYATKLCSASGAIRNYSVHGVRIVFSTNIPSTIQP